MKFSIKNRLNTRVGRRFKWMSIAFICVLAFQYVFSDAITNIQEFQYVEASNEDESFEQSDVYNAYIKSAKL